MVPKGRISAQSGIIFNIGIYKKIIIKSSSKKVKGQKSLNLC